MTTYFEAQCIAANHEATKWYHGEYGVTPHKETRHGGDQIVRAYAMGIVAAKAGRPMTTDEVVTLITIQKLTAPHGSVS